MMYRFQKSNTVNQFLVKTFGEFGKKERFFTEMVFFEPVVDLQALMNDHS